VPSLKAGALVLGLTLATAVMTACTLPASAVCLDYVACQAAVDDSVDTSPWDEGGSCWNLPDTARRCESQCRVALDALRETPDPPAACEP